MSETPLRSFLAASSLPNKSPGVPPSALLSAHSVRFGARYCVKEPELGDLEWRVGWGWEHKWIPRLQENTLEAQWNFVVYEEHVKPIKCELSSCCCSFCRLLVLLLSPAVSPPPSVTDARGESSHAPAVTDERARASLLFFTFWIFKLLPSIRSFSHTQTCTRSVKTSWTTL